MKMSESDHKQFHYGGQAVLEGVMMRGPKDFTVAVRRPDGVIVTSTEDVDSILGRFKWLDKPFLRGTLALIDALALGIKALTFSANVSLQEHPEEGQTETPVAPESNSKVTNIAIGAAMVLGLLLGLGLFLAVPILIVKPLNSVVKTGWVLTAIEGGVKVGILLAYVSLISLMRDIRRVFQYHGAEHKTINAYEAGEELTVGNVSRYSKVHVRCGTSFLLVVIVAGVLVFMVIADHLPLGSLTTKGYLSYLVRWGYKLALMPFVAGIAYEVIRFAGKRKDSFLARLLVMPGMLMQRITTREPEPDMIEVAIKSLDGVLARESERRESDTEDKASVREA